MTKAIETMIKNLLDTITNVIALSPGERDIVTSLFKEKSYKKGDFFLVEGQICKQVGFVSRGLLRYYINHDGEDKTYAFTQENNFVCNYESFIPRTPSTKNIQALEDCEVLQISYDDLQLFYQSIRQAERFGRIVIEQVFIETLQDLSSFYTDTPELRYEKILKRHPDLLQRMSQYHIASYVGVKPQSLSRIRKRIFTEK
ncbi:cAMP-binding domain of CRP or a regulatory subunit of cAMP-dependent protein kinases [Pedobacter westerhofensis]|uniref:cAMP-binding domain of CRP or a regulatory subunit of cAMP-dependent protein kinases n=2 Tax=Pedobacter westerhofensis TaxID=425512 RepID=A0A521AG97_9SPHI|nr:cAMP-binding domain of CRP or a regulatory subunit of cAMP-dependent protein kinases [Pedobacter westerhofensis]